VILVTVDTLKACENRDIKQPREIKKMTYQELRAARYEAVCAMSTELRKAEKLVKKGKLDSKYTVEYNRLLKLHHELDSQLQIAI
jgi:hypothetical protein